jgi:hypothetical protein
MPGNTWRRNGSDRSLDPTAGTYNLIGRSGELEHLAGAISLGELGSTLRRIFDPAVQAEFEQAGGAPRRQTSVHTPHPRSQPDPLSRTTGDSRRSPSSVRKIEPQPYFWP